MKKYFIFSIVTLLAMASCTMQETLIQEAEPVEVKDVYHVGFGDYDTKTAIDASGRLYWHNGDAISIFRSTANMPYVYEGETGARKADFVRADDGFYAGEDIPSTIAVYPYDMNTYIPDYDSGVVVNFSSYQEYTEGSFARGAAPMVAVTKDTKDRELYFKNLAGFLVIPAYGDVNVKRVEFSKPGGIGTTFLVKPSSGADPEMVEYTSTGIYTLDCSRNPVALSNDRFTEFWITLPPMAMEDGFSVKFVTDEGEFLFWTNTKRTIVRNVVNRMTPVSLCSEDIPWEYFTDPSTGKPMVFTFNQDWWGETAEGYIKYRTIGDVRYCVTETFPHGGGYGFWGLSSTQEEAVEWHFLWHLNNDTIELPYQFTGYYASNYNADVYVFDEYHYYKDILGYELDDWDYCYNNYNHGYYDGNGGFYLYSHRYYVVDVGFYGSGYCDNILEAQTYYDRRQFWISVYDDVQTGAEKTFHFNTGRDVSRFWYTVKEGHLAESRAYSIAQSLYGGSDYVEVSNQQATVSLNLGVSGEYTIVAITDGGEYTYLHFDYQNPEESELGITIETFPGQVTGRSMGILVKGTSIVEAYVQIFLPMFVPEEPSSWVNSYNAITGDNLAALNADGYSFMAEGLSAGREHLVVVVASDGVMQKTFTASFTTPELQYEELATASFTGSVWWDSQESVKLCRDLSTENGYVFTNWGDGGIDFPFIWNQDDNTLRVPTFWIGDQYSRYGLLYYTESRDYFTITDQSDSRLQPSYYEDGVFHFHVALNVAAGTFGDYWEVFTLTQ